MRHDTGNLALDRFLDQWKGVRPLWLDSFCGEGGMGVGAFLAGFAVFGVDTNRARLKRYPFHSHRGDAIAFVMEHGHLFDVNHGSPTCTGYSRGTAAVTDRLERYDRLIPATREAMRFAGKPYVIENVNDARPELVDPALLCGRQFRLEARDDDGTRLVMDRHRLFETSWRMPSPDHPAHDRSLQVAGSYGGARRDKVEARQVRRGGYVPSADVQRDLLGAWWMSEKGAMLSIPPVYGAYVATSARKALDL